MHLNILIRRNNKPMYEQITSQIKEQIMNGTLQSGQAIPSIRAMAKLLHISAITVQRAYKELHRDGFIETDLGRGNFVSARNASIYQEEQQRQAEDHLREAADLGRTAGISLSKLIEHLTMFYQEKYI